MNNLINTEKQVIWESEKAAAVDMLLPTDWDEPKRCRFFFPKSQCNLSEDGTLMVPEWLLKAKIREVCSENRVRLSDELEAMLGIEKRVLTYNPWK